MRKRKFGGNQIVGRHFVYVGQTRNIKELYMTNIRRIFNSLFEWENLPKGLKSYFIERFLFDYGVVAFYKVDDTFYCLPAFIQDFDVYFEYLTAFAYSPYKGVTTMGEISDINAQVNTNLANNKSIDIKDKQVQGEIAVNPLPNSGQIKGVFIYNNIDKQSTLSPILPLLDLINKTYNEIFNDINNSKSVRLLSATSDAKAKSISRVMNRLYDQNAPFIVLNKGKMEDISEMKMFEGASKLSDIWSSYRNSEELLARSLGLIFDNRADKKERVLESEINVSNFQASHILLEMLEHRKNAVKEINKTFGTNIVVKLSELADSVVSNPLHQDMNAGNKTIMNFGSGDKKPQGDENE